MKNIIKKFRILILVSLVFFITIVTLDVIPTSHDVIVPAAVDDLGDVYSFEGVDTTDVNVYSVSILEYYNVSVLNYLQAKLNPYAIFSTHSTYVNTSLSYSYSSGTIQKNVSLTNAIISGYRAANAQIDYSFKGDIIHSIYGSGDSYFQLGDIVTSCEGIEITENCNVSKCLQQTHGVVERNGLYYVNIELNVPYHFTVLRSGKEVEFDAYAFAYTEDDVTTPILGISYYNYYTIKSTDIDYKITNPSTIGPSAGLMQSLFVYDALTGNKLTKGLKIVGTGTVDADGNAGAIGGIEAKVYAAYLHGADIFFVPSANYEDALKSYNKLNTKMQMVEVTCLQDVIDYLVKVQGAAQ